MSETKAMDPKVRRYFEVQNLIRDLSKEAEAIMKDLGPLPGQMDEHFWRQWPDKGGSLTIEIANAGHFADTLNFASQQGVEPAFWNTFKSLIQVALGPTLAQKQVTWKDKDEAGNDREQLIPATQGRDGKIRIVPDGYREPSFSWLTTIDGKQGLHGGMICHRHSRDWALHT